MVFTNSISHTRTTLLDYDRQPITDEPDIGGCMQKGLGVPEASWVDKRKEKPAPHAWCHLGRQANPGFECGVKSKLSDPWFTMRVG